MYKVYQTNQAQVRQNSDNILHSEIDRFTGETVQIEYPSDNEATSVKPAAPQDCILPPNSSKMSNSTSESPVSEGNAENSFQKDEDSENNRPVNYGNDSECGSSCKKEDPGELRRYLLNQTKIAGVAASENDEIIAGISADLLEEIEKMSQEIGNYLSDAAKPTAFTRIRLLPPDVFLTICCSWSGIETIETLLDSAYLAAFFNECPTVTAFLKRRALVTPELFIELFRRYTLHFTPKNLWHGYTVCCADGTSLYSLENPNEPFNHIEGTKGKKGFNQMHCVAMLCEGIFVNACFQHGRKSDDGKGKDECRGFVELIKSMPRQFDDLNLLYIADRNFPSFNDIAWVENVGQHYIFRTPKFRAKGLLGGNFKENANLDITVTRKFTRKNTQETRLNPDYYVLGKDQTFDDTLFDENGECTLTIRVIARKLESGEWEYLYTNIMDIPADEIFAQYFSRWLIEVDFNKLKNTVGAHAFNSRKEQYIQMELFGRLIFYNFIEQLRKVGIDVEPSQLESAADSENVSNTYTEAERNDSVVIPAAEEDCKPEFGKSVSMDPKASENGHGTEHGKNDSGTAADSGNSHETEYGMDDPGTAADSGNGHGMEYGMDDSGTAADSGNGHGMEYGMDDSGTAADSGNGHETEYGMDDSGTAADSGNGHGMESVGNDSENTVFKIYENESPLGNREINAGKKDTDSSFSRIYENESISRNEQTNDEKNDSDTGSAGAGENDLVPPDRQTDAGKDDSKSAAIKKDENNCSKYGSDDNDTSNAGESNKTKQKREPNFTTAMDLAHRLLFNGKNTPMTRLIEYRSGMTIGDLYRLMNEMPTFGMNARLKKNTHAVERNRKAERKAKATSSQAYTYRH